MEQEREEWRPVVGHEEQLEVSNFGRVRRIRDGFIYSIMIDGGHAVCKLWIAGKRKQLTLSIGNAVACAFLEPPPKGKRFYAKHKDGDLRNNRPENLYWIEAGSWLRDEEVHKKRAASLMTKRKPEQEIEVDTAHEEWRPVVGAEQYYEVSNMGRVRRIQTGQVLSPYNRLSGYTVSLGFVPRKSRNQSVARLVATAFLGAPADPTMEAYHKDKNKFNNQADNLCWVPHGMSIRSDEVRRRGLATQQSQEYRARISAARKALCNSPEGRLRMTKMSHMAAEKNCRRIICIETGVIYPSAKAAAGDLNCNSSVLTNSCRNATGRLYRRMASSPGKPVFHFRYYNPEDYKPKERIWKPVVGFEGKYEVSNLGEVRHTTFKKILKARLGNMGCWTVGLSTGKGSRHYLISRLVAKTFIPEVYGACHVAHRDGDPSNNCVTNLFWTTPNNAEFTRYNISKGKHKRPVICVETGVCYPSMKEAAQACGVDIRNVFTCCKREKTRQNTHRVWRGKPILHFRYADQ